MRTRIVLCAGIVLCLAGVLEAQTNDWIPLPGKKLWSNADNWEIGVPTSSHKAKFNAPDECIVDFEGAEAKNVDLSGGPLRIVNGGSLTVYDWFIVGYGDDDIGEEKAGRLEVHDGGVLNCMRRLYVGRLGEGYLTVYEGGTINVHEQSLHIAQTATGTGVVTLEGGSINLLEGTGAQGLQHTGEASVDFRGGAITLRDTTQSRAYLETAIGDGIIKAYGGVGEVVVDPNETPGRIVIRGVHPLKPFPADDSRASAGSVELSWTFPDPCVPGQPVNVDVYFTDDLQLLEYFTDPAAIQVVSNQNVTSVVVGVQSKTRYYWAVDTYIGDPNDPVFGPIFSFIADNLPPTVDAGDDVATWLEDGPRTENLDATVTDDDAYTVQWTVVSEPNAGDAVIQTANAEDTSITLSAVGEYVLQLEASDGEYTGSDTVTINVYNDSCEAAKSLPDFEPLPGDINEDCIVDVLDIVILLENWLQCNALDCDDLGL